MRNAYAIIKEFDNLSAFRNNRIFFPLCAEKSFISRNINENLRVYVGINVCSTLENESYWMKRGCLFRKSVDLCTKCYMTSETDINESLNRYTYLVVFTNSTILI